MTKEDISYIESQLRVELPEHYVHFLLHYPDDLAGLAYHEEYVIDDPYYLIRLNSMFSRSGVPAPFFAIGHNLGGDYYFIKLSGSETTVYYFDHEETADREDDHYWEKSLTAEHQSLADFKTWLLQTLGE